MFCLHSRHIRLQSRNCGGTGCRIDLLMTSGIRGSHEAHRSLYMMGDDLVDSWSRRMVVDLQHLHKVEDFLDTIGVRIQHFFGYLQFVSDVFEHGLAYCATYDDEKSQNEPVNGVRHSYS